MNDTQNLEIKFTGLDSDDPIKSLELRHSIEKELKDRGLDVIGGGMGIGFMDISYIATRTSMNIVDQTMAKFGIEPEFYNIT